jgi:hypothetical protein
MSEVSRPLQVVLILTLAFAGLWFVALRPKGDAATSTPPTPAPKTAAPAAKSPIPGGLGSAVDKAKATKAQGDAAAATADGRAAPALKPVAPAPAAAAKPAPIVKPAAKAVKPAAPAPARTVHAPRKTVTGVTPATVRHALSSGRVVALLFYSPVSSDDRAVRDELARVDRRSGHVVTLSVSVNGLARFRNVLHGVNVVQSPTVVVLGRKAPPRVLEGYTDHAEIDQATLVALLRG